VEKKKYAGTEKGLNKYKKAHKELEKTEGGRYKNSKKKNKGRKVTVS